MQFHKWNYKFKSQYKFLVYTEEMVKVIQNSTAEKKINVKNKKGKVARVKGKRMLTDVDASRFLGGDSLFC